jgi:hypothetical protein
VNATVATTCPVVARWMLPWKTWRIRSGWWARSRLHLPVGWCSRGTATRRAGLGGAYGRRVANLPIRLEHTVVRCWCLRQFVGINREMRYESAAAARGSHADAIEQSPSKCFDQLTLRWCRVREDCVADHSPDANGLDMGGM